MSCAPVGPRPFNVVLVEPEIHFNVGNVGRTCVGAGAALHLVGRLGFSLDSAQLRRAGLDYWEKLELRRHADYESFEESLPAGEKPLFFSADGGRDFWEAPYREGGNLVFGKESVGLPAALRARHRERTFRIPHGPGIRSLNLSSAVAVVLYEALRQTNCSGALEDSRRALPCSCSWLRTTEYVTRDSTLQRPPIRKK